MASAKTDMELENLAKEIIINTNLDGLCLNLGYEYAEKDIYKADNHSGSSVTHQGTEHVQMLNDGRDEISQEQQRPILTKAMKDAGLVRLADIHFGAFLVITYLTWAAVSVSGTTPELSTTAGDTVNIPCLFGEGTLSNIFWSYNGGTGLHKILSLAGGESTIEPEYANRASLQDDLSTLILKGITVADEGTYLCVVDRLKQTAVPNIKTKLNVFNLRPDTLPVISPCIGADEPSSCSIHANQSFTLTCTLPNVYPVEDTELTWYQDGKRVSSIDDVTQNDDRTTDVSREIRVSETGKFTCNATFRSVNGKDNTAVSVEAWIIPPADVPNTPGTNVTGSQITWKIICIVLLICIIPVIITSFIYRLKARVEFSTSPPSSTLRQRNVNRANSVTPSSLDILERFIKSGLHPKGDKRVDWPYKKTVVCLIDYSDNSKDIVIKHNEPYPTHAEEILIENINSKLDKTKIKCITIYLNFSSCSQCSVKLQTLKKQIPDLQIKFSAYYYIRRPSCTLSCCCYTDDPESFKMLRKLDARPFQKVDWDKFISLLMKYDAKKGRPTSDLNGLRYGDEYGVWRNEDDEKMRADYEIMSRV